METMTSSASTSGRAHIPIAASSRVPSGRQALLAAPRRRRSDVRRDAIAFGGAASAWGAADSAANFSMLSQLASVTGFAIGAWWFSREISLEEQRKNQFNERCTTCQGTGRMPCICQRWSDSDVGCGSCQNTGFTICRDCRGGGTKVPVARVAPIYVDDDNKYRKQQHGPYDQ